MTQRFGRNKRRAAREAVAHALGAAQHAGARAALAENAAARAKEESSRANRLMNDISERLLSAVGRNSALLPLELQPKHNGWDGPRFPIARDLDGFAISRMRDYQPNIVMEQSYVELLRLVGHVERNRYDFSTLIRFENVYEDRGVGGFSTRAFCISRETMRSIGLASDIKHLADDIAEGLVGLQKGRS